MRTQPPSCLTRFGGRSARVLLPVFFPVLQKRACQDRQTPLAAAPSIPHRRDGPASHCSDSMWFHSRVIELTAVFSLYMSNVLTVLTLSIILVSVSLWCSPSQYNAEQNHRVKLSFTLWYFEGHFFIWCQRSSQYLLRDIQRYIIESVMSSKCVCGCPRGIQ